MKKELSEGLKMWLSVMAVFLAYATIFILFEDYDRKFIMPFNEVSDWHLLLFSLVVMAGEWTSASVASRPRRRTACAAN